MQVFFDTLIIIYLFPSYHFTNIYILISIEFPFALSSQMNSRRERVENEGS